MLHSTYKQCFFPVVFNSRNVCPFGMNSNSVSHTLPEHLCLDRKINQHKRHDQFNCFQTATTQMFNQVLVKKKYYSKPFKDELGKFDNRRTEQHAEKIVFGMDSISNTALHGRVMPCSRIQNDCYGCVMPPCPRTPTDRDY